MVALNTDRDIVILALMQAAPTVMGPGSDVFTRTTQDITDRAAMGTPRITTMRPRHVLILAV